MLGLLVLFLTANADDNGFAWSRESSMKFLGFYSGLIFAAPALGGWVASRWIGERRAILAGGLLVACGHLLLGGPVYFLQLTQYLSGIDIPGALTGSGIRFNSLLPSDSQVLGILDAVNDIDATAENVMWIRASYILKLWSFLGGLGLIVIGTGLIKPSVSSIINHFYPPGDAQRQSGFTIFMVFIYIGSFTANLIAGTLGEKVGWHVGFSAAAIGMIIGVLVYYLGQDKHLGDIGRQPQARVAENHVASKVPLDPNQLKRILLLFVMGAFTVIYAVAFYQKGGLLNLYARQYVTRDVAGFEIPATWLLMISTGVFMFFGTTAIRYLTRRAPSLDTVGKLALGLFAIAIGYGILSFAEYIRVNTIVGEVSILWMILAYIFFGIGDILVWPAQIAAAAALAPKHLVSFFVGSWYITIGIGSWLTGYVGALADVYDHSTVFILIGTTTILCGMLLLACRRRLAKLACGVSV